VASSVGLSGMIACDDDGVRLVRLAVAVALPDLHLSTRACM